MTIESRHTVSAYDNELQRLDKALVHMGQLALDQLGASQKILLEPDRDEARRILEKDGVIDQLEQSIITETTQMVALRQPVCDDLRLILAAQRISGELERIADYASNFSIRAAELNHTKVQSLIEWLCAMGMQVRELVAHALEAFQNRDLVLAKEVWKRDVEIDKRYIRLFKSIVEYMIAHPEDISTCTHLLFMAKNMERIGDHATNITEAIYFIVEGELPKAPRPKRDNISLMDDG